MRLFATSTSAICTRLGLLFLLVIMGVTGQQPLIGLLAGPLLLSILLRVSFLPPPRAVNRENTELLSKLAAMPTFGSNQAA